MSDVLESWREILHIGVPNAGARMIIPLGQGVITRVIATFGPAAVAGYGVATRIEFFSLAALNALSSVIPAFIGQNLGAGHLDRVDAGFRVSRRFALYVGGALFPRVSWPLRRGSPRCLTATPRWSGPRRCYMRIVSAAYAAQGLYLVISAGLNVLKRPLTAAGLGVMEMFVLAIPLVLLGAHLAGDHRYRNCNFGELPGHRSRCVDRGYASGQVGDSISLIVVPIDHDHERSTASRIFKRRDGSAESTLRTARRSGCGIYRDVVTSCSSRSNVSPWRCIANRPRQLGHTVVSPSWASSGGATTGPQNGTVKHQVFFRGVSKHVGQLSVSVETLHHLRDGGIKLTSRILRRLLRSPAQRASPRDTPACSSSRQTRRRRRESVRSR